MVRERSDSQHRSFLAETHDEEEGGLVCAIPEGGTRQVEVGSP